MHILAVRYEEDLASDAVPLILVLAQERRRGQSVGIRNIVAMHPVCRGVGSKATPMRSGEEPEEDASIAETLDNPGDARSSHYCRLRPAYKGAPTYRLDRIASRRIQTSPISPCALSAESAGPPLLRRWLPAGSRTFATLYGFRPHVLRVGTSLVFFTAKTLRRSR